MNGIWWKCVRKYEDSIVMSPIWRNKNHMPRICVFETHRTHAILHNVHCVWIHEVLGSYIRIYYASSAIQIQAISTIKIISKTIFVYYIKPHSQMNYFHRAAMFVNIYAVRSYPWCFLWMKLSELQRIINHKSLSELCKHNCMLAVSMVH